MDIAKRISNLKDTIATAKAEKTLARQKMDEIEKKLEKKGIKIENLKEVIAAKKEELVKLTSKLEEQLEVAENVLDKSDSGKDK